MRKKEYVNLPKGDTVPINPQIEKQVRKTEKDEKGNKGARVETKSEPAVMAEMKLRKRKKR